MLAHQFNFSVFAKDSFFDESKNMIICKEPLPEFSLGKNSNPKKLEIKTLCKCIWGQFPKSGWEREVSVKIRNGKDPGWRGRALISRFGKAFQKCGGYNL